MNCNWSPTKTNKIPVQYLARTSLWRDCYKIPTDHIRAACKAFVEKLEAIIRARVGNIEQ